MDTLRRLEEQDDITKDSQRLQGFQKEIKSGFHMVFDRLYCEFVNAYILEYPDASIETLDALREFNEFLKERA
jgi:hypothetical protein